MSGFIDTDIDIDSFKINYKWPTKRYKLTQTNSYMKKENFNYGDIIATRSNSWLSRMIRKFMKKGWSHTAVVINIWNQMWIAEALAWGVRIYPIEDSAYLKDGTELIILRHKKGFTSKMIDNMSWKMVSLGGVRYQYENLPMWAAKLLLKIGMFKKDNEKSIYCSELAAIAINTAYPHTFNRPNETSPDDHITKDIYNIITDAGIESGVHKDIQKLKAMA